MQQNGCFNFITTAMNNGNPYPYNLGAICLFNAGSGSQVWLSTAATNTTTPGAMGANWIPLTAGRPVLTGNANYYVNPSTGNDSNAGSSGAPWLTLQHAWNWISANLDLGGFGITVNCYTSGTETYTAGLIAIGDLVGNTQGAAGLIFLGNSSTPDDCVVNVTNSTCFYAQSGAKFTVNGYKLAATGANPGGCGILADTNSIILGQNIDYGACAISHTQGARRGMAQNVSGISISGGGATHLRALEGGEAYESGVGTVTTTGSVSYSEGFASTLVGGIIEARGNTYSGGTTTGPAFNANTGIIDTNTGTPNSYFPNSTAGATANGGVCL